MKLTGQVVSMRMARIREFPFIEGEIAGVRGKFMLDTGMQDALVINDHRVPLAGGRKVGSGHFGSGQTFDVSLNPFVADRDGIGLSLATVRELAECDPEAFIKGSKTVFTGVGPGRLRTFAARARLLTTPGATAYLTAPVELPVTAEEIFFDIEADPMRDVVYLHGFVHRTDRDPATERFVSFTAEEATPAAERDAFASAMAHFAAHPAATVYYYSKYERTSYRKLQRRFPDVCGAEEVEALFERPRSVDLYFDVVTKATEWPTRNHSIKTLAKHLGFCWRDVDPSGAASIEWYDRWIQAGDRQILQRILDYNEDDCRATAVLLDGIRTLS